MEVAKFFDVSKPTVLKWQRELAVNVEYHPEIPRAKAIKCYLRKQSDRTRVAQWICDEGRISTIHDSELDETFLIVGGNMTDVEVLKRIAEILHEKATRDTGSPHPRWLPVSAVKVRSAEAYALLQAIHEELVGLKKMEAEAALGFFPQTGFLRGTHPTAEFMTSVWKAHGRNVIAEWNRRNPAPVSPAQEGLLLKTWLSNRLRKGKWNRNLHG